MKKSIKLLLGLLSVVCISCLCGACADKPSRGGESEFLAYTLSDVVMTQKSINTYSFEFSADCAGDEAKVYFTENDKIKSADSPVTVESEEKDGLVRFSFTKDLQLSEEYYLWVVSDKKEVMLPITAPSMFPSMETRLAGGAIFHFNYTAGVSWSSFCDPAGKAVYVGDSPVYDGTAQPVEEGVAITEGESIIPAAKFDESKYYYSVTTAKNGLLKIISSPVTLTSSLYEQFTGIKAKINSDLTLEVNVNLDSEGSIAKAEASDLQLVVKSGAGDEIYSANSVWNSGTAKFTFDCTLLLKAGLWYDVMLAYKGAIVCDVPKVFNNTDVLENAQTGLNGYNYCLTSWKPDGAPEEDAALKVYFEKNTTIYADEYCKGYIVSLDNSDGLVLTVTVTLKQGVTDIPELAITADSKDKIVSAKGVADGEGSYVCTLDISSALTEAGKWYDIRLFFGNTCAELLKDSCISYSDFAKEYPNNGRHYVFKEWNGILKITFDE